MGVRFAPRMPGRFAGWGLLVTLCLGALGGWPAGGAALPPGPKPTPLSPAPHASTAAVREAETSVVSADVGAAASTFKMLTCGAVDSSFTTTSSSLRVVRSCELDVPEAGVAFVSASSSVAASSNNFSYRLRTNLSVDSADGNSATDRYVSVNALYTDGTDKSTATSLLAPVGAGEHTFYYLAARQSGIGTVTLIDATISVLFVPASAADVQSCGSAGDLAWTTTADNFEAIRSCTLSVPGDGLAFISANGTARLLDTTVEGRFRVGVDSPTGTAASDRWLNIYAGTFSGSEENVATSIVEPVSAGSHTFYFSAYRYSGSGTVQVLDPTLSVLYFRTPNTTARLCSSSGQDTWTNATNEFATLRSCTLTVPEATTAYIDAGGSAGLNAGGAENEWKGLFRVGVDSSSGSSATDRRIHVVADAAPGDGSDRPVVESQLVQVSAGARTFSFVGRRYNGAGTLRVYSPGLSVIVPLPVGLAAPTSTPLPPTPVRPTTTPVGPAPPTPSAPAAARRTTLLPFVQR